MKTINEIKDNTSINTIVDKMIKSNGLYCLVSEPKVGKSFLALQLADALINNKEFLGFKVSPTPVLYISTELSGHQLKERIDLTNYEINNNFLFIEKDKEHPLSLRDDLLFELSDFSQNYKGKLVIIDVMCGIDYCCNLDINNYTDVMKNMFDKYRELSNKFNLSFLLIHHLNKSGRTLGSTGIDSNMNGILTLIDNKDGTYNLKVINRDFEEININLIKNNNCIFEVIDEDNTDVDKNIMLFARYVMKKKDISFIMSDIITQLDLDIMPSRFGRLLNMNIKKLEQEGIFIENNRTGKARTYRAIFMPKDI